MSNKVIELFCILVEVIEYLADETSFGVRFLLDFSIRISEHSNVITFHFATWNYHIISHTNTSIKPIYYIYCISKMYKCSRVSFIL